jgi:hypothetical protein
VELAELQLSAYRSSWADTPRRKPMVQGLFVVWAGAVVVLAVVRIAEREWSGMPAGLLVLIVMPGAFRRQRRMLERAIERNSDVPPGE